MKKIEVFFLTFILSLFFSVVPSYSWADQTNDFYIQQALAHYFTLPTEVHALSMGGSTDVSCTGSACLFLNPAGLADTNQTELVLSVSSRESSGDEFLEQDSIREWTKDAYGYVSIPLKSENENTYNYGVLSFGYSRYQGSVNDRISTSPDGYRLTGGYAYNLDGINLGYSATFYDDQLHTDLSDLHSHSRFLHVFGAQTQLSDTIRFAASFKLGIGQSDTEEGSSRANGLSHLKQYTGNLGLTKKIDRLTLAGSFDYTHVESRGNLEPDAPAVVVGRSEDGDVYGLRSGAEYSVTEQFPIRLGVRWYRVANYDFQDIRLDDLSGSIHGMGYSGGLGYIFKNNETYLAKLDYGAEYFTVGHGAWQHMLTLTVPLNLLTGI